MTLRELYEKMEHATEEQKEHIWEVMEEMADAFKKSYPKTYKKYADKLHDILCDHGLTEEEAKLAASKLQNKDGSYGAHWNEETIRKVVDTYPELAKCPFWTVYYVMNMIYSDYYDPTFSTATYVKLALSFMHDKDAPEDKVEKYIAAMQ